MTKIGLGKRLATVSFGMVAGRRWEDSGRVTTILPGVTTEQMR